MLVERGPGSKIIPSEIGRNAIEVRLALALGGTRLEDGIIDRDVLALGIELGKCGIEFSCPVRLGDVFQIGSGLRKVLANSVGQGSRAPDEHAAVPKIVAGIEEFSRLLGVGLFGEAAHAED